MPELSFVGLELLEILLPITSFRMVGQMSLFWKWARMSIFFYESLTFKINNKLTNVLKLCQLLICYPGLAVARHGMDQE